MVQIVFHILQHRSPEVSPVEKELLVNCIRFQYVNLTLAQLETLSMSEKEYLSAKKRRRANRGIDEAMLQQQGCKKFSAGARKENRNSMKSFTSFIPKRDHPWGNLQVYDDITYSSRGSLQQYNKLANTDYITHQKKKPRSKKRILDACISTKREKTLPKGMKFTEFISYQCPQEPYPIERESKRKKTEPQQDVTPINWKITWEPLETFDPVVEVGCLFPEINQ